jgi:hypothetical protein
MNFFNNPNRIPESYGIKIAITLSIYFVVMNLAGFAHHVELRLLNLVILLAGVYFALKKFKETHGSQLNYFRALATGVSTAAIGSFIFAMFLFAYMSLDSSLMESIIKNDPMGRYLNPYLASFIVALEGLFSGLLVTFILINFITTDEVNEPQG